MPALAGAAENYSDMVLRAQTGEFSTAIVLYLDPSAAPGTASGRDALAAHGCKIGIASRTQQWADLVAALQAETPAAVNAADPDLKWGIVFSKTGGGAAAG